MLRVIAVDRAHPLPGALRAGRGDLPVRDNKATLNSDFTQILKDLQGGLGGPVNNTNHGLLHDLQRLFAVSTSNLYMLGVGVAAYAVLEGVEAVGLWTGQRWAEYLTFIATVVFVPYEIYELTKSITALKLVTLIINVAIVLYLIIAKRLFGVRGGGKAERAEYRAGHRVGGHRARDAPARAHPIRRASGEPRTSAGPRIPGSRRTPDAAAPQEAPVSQERPATDAAGR